MLDRIAESLYWIGRYTERAENHARLLDVFYHLREDGDTGEESVWKRMVESIGDTALYERKFGEYREKEVLFFLTIDSELNNSLLRCVAQARDNLKKIREQLPAELWSLLNGFYLWLRNVKPAEIVEESPHRLFQKVKDGLAAFQGTARSITPRDELWHMMEAGRHLERSENVIRLLQSVRAALPEPGSASYGYTMAMLKSVGGTEAFRRLDIGEAGLEEVSRFLILQDTFPRSVHYSLTRFERHLQALRLPGARSGSGGIDRMLRMAGKVRSELGYLDRGDVTLDNLDPMLRQLSASSRQLEDLMARTFFFPGREVTA
ncbi:alpha-E domain-containing protein [Cohnella caldifontis]|uniref:alpha-E domain-containing protein n=1 Tax=Cohnella caldifontis TaxID=3027471 RepID=UPI0023EB981F|nr:alpha-E domain-containing protein [Cohnella sp. YIM B05605]